MRWNLLFADLENQLSDVAAAATREQRRETERMRRSKLTLAERLRLSYAGPAVETLTVTLRHHDSVRIRPETFGTDWLAGALPDAERTGTSHCVLPFAAIASIIASRDDLKRGLSGSAGATSGLAARIELNTVLRELSRRRVSVRVSSRASVMSGTIDGCYHDHIDLALHESDSARRERDVLGYRIIPISEILLVSF